MSEVQRKTIYAAVSALLVVLVAYNIIEQDKVEVWLNLVGAVLPLGATLLAYANTGTGKHRAE